MKQSIEDVGMIYRPVFARATNDDLRAVNWLSAILFLLTIALATTGHVTGHALAWAFATALAFASGVTYGIYFEHEDDAADEIEDTDAQRYEHSRDWE